MGNQTAPLSRWGLNMPMQLLGFVQTIILAGRWNGGRKARRQLNVPANIGIVQGQPVTRTGTQAV